VRLRPIALPPLILVILWAGAVWWPLRSGTSSEQERLATIQAEQLSLVSTIDGLNTATDQLAAYDADLDRFAVAIPAQLDMATFIRQIDAEAGASGIQIDLLSPNEVLGGSTRDAKRPLPIGVSSVTLSLAGQGSFESAMDFVERLTALPRLVVVDVFGLSAVDGDAEQIIVDLELRVFTTEALVANAQSAAFTTGTASGDPEEVDDLVQPWIEPEGTTDSSETGASP
jgi:Tfp pilus assembly protein PilO